MTDSRTITSDQTVYNNSSCLGYISTYLKLQRKYCNFERNIFNVRDGSFQPKRLKMLERVEQCGFIIINEVITTLEFAQE